MAGRFVYWMNVSLDLYIEREAGEHGDIESPSWIRIDEPLHREFNARARAMSVMVQGRTVYEMMDTFWPTARTDESLPGFLREYGEIWTDIPKVLVSRTRTTAEHNTRIIGGDNDAIEQLALLGGRRTATSASGARPSPRSCCGRTCSTNYCCSHTRSYSAPGARFSTRSTNPSN